MKFISDITSSTASEQSRFSEGSEEGGATAVVESVHRAPTFLDWIPAELGERTIVSRRGDGGVNWVIVIASSSTITERSSRQSVSCASGSSSAGEPGVTEDLYSKVLSLFVAARSMDFEEGIHTEFSRSLVRLIELLGNSAVEVVASVILRGKANPTVAAEALKWIGHIDQAKSYAFRLWLLEESLRSPFAIVRDAALLGVASLDDQHSIPAINDAISRETCPELREDLNQVLMQLDPQCHLYSER
jgi:hypothetical protein